LKNVLSIDVENWYDRSICQEQYGERKLKPRYTLLSDSIDLILRLFNKYKKETTFFILGNVAKENPEILERINDHGHEIALHGYSHINLSSLSIIDFRNDLKKSIKLFKKLIGISPKGFRAPNFSLGERQGWALKLLSMNSFLYDSSIFPVFTFKYGSNKTRTCPYYPSFSSPYYEDTTQSKIIEFPLLTRKFLFWRLPAAGGFYLRLFGSNYILESIKKMNKRGYPAMCYAHPWEIFGFPQVRLPLLTKVYGYYRIPCNKLLEHLLKNIKCSPTIDILNDMGIS